MFYNERVISDTSASAKVYEGNQGKAMMKQGDKLKEYGDDLVKQGRTMQGKAYENILSDAMNKLSSDEQLMSNPQALGQELDKVAKSVTADINDDDMKLNVLTSFELSKGALINRATTNMKRIQAENNRSLTYDSIYKNIDSLSASFGNAISGDYDENDIVNYQYSLAKIKESVNARNLDGTYMFTDAQRRAMAKDADSAVIGGFIDTYSKLPEAQRKTITEAIKSDSYNIKLSEDASISLKDAVGETTYKDIRRNIDKYNALIKAQEKREAKLQQEQALDDFRLYPTEDGLNYLKSTYSFSKKTLDELDEILENTPNYDAVTTFADAEALDFALDEFTNADFNDFGKASEKAIGLINKAMRSNAKGSLTDEDSNSFRDSIMAIMRDENKRRGFQELSHYKKTLWEKAADLLYYNTSLTESQKDIKKRAANNKIENLAIEGASIANGLIKESRFDDAKKVLGEYRKKIIIAAHPELADKEIGDRITIDGIVYEVTGEESLKPLL
jgi:hypothetical protein